MDAIPIEKLADLVGSRYALAVGTAKRARQLKEGAIPLVKCATKHPVTIALHEIAAGKVVVKAVGEAGDTPATDGRADSKADDTLGDGDLFDGELFVLDADDEPTPDDVADEVDEDEEDEEDDEDLEDEDIEDVEIDLGDLA